VGGGGVKVNLNLLLANSDVSKFIAAFIWTLTLDL
jgi:hypothetical protein